MATSDERKLSPKAQQFINEYLTDGNGKQAAIRAGYAPKAAEVQASRLLRNAQVAEAVRARQQQLQKKAGVSAERVVEELARIGLVDPRMLFDARGRVIAVKRLPEDVARAIASVETTVETTGTGKTRTVATTTKVRFWEKPKALHTMAHILGMLKDKVELTGGDGKPIRVVFGGRHRAADGATRKR